VLGAVQLLMPDVLAREREFLERLTSSMAHMQQYEDPLAQVSQHGVHTSVWGSLGQLPQHGARTAGVSIPWISFRSIAHVQQCEVPLAQEPQHGAHTTM
jgi:hypothetical protein